MRIAVSAMLAALVATSLPTAAWCVSHHHGEQSPSGAGALIYHDSGWSGAERFAWTKIFDGHEVRLPGAVTVTGWCQLRVASSFLL